MNFIWNQSNKHTWAFVVYILGRYSPLVQYTLAIGTCVPLSMLVCDFAIPFSLIVIPDDTS